MNIPAYNAIQIEALKLATRKNADYSGNKIDNLAITGVPGIAVRLLDKVSRIFNLSGGVESQVKTESMRDTLIDVINYATFAVMMIDDTWKATSVADLDAAINRMQQSRSALLISEGRIPGDNNA